MSHAQYYGGFNIGNFWINCHQSLKLTPDQYILSYAIYPYDVISYAYKEIACQEFVLDLLG